MSAYYNEIDPLKAEILREAIKANAIAPGDVDERSIADVAADDLRGYSQCHFFAGGGFWSLVLRHLGLPDDWEAWTGSCPCPSFSVAGKGAGFDDPRHLWPHWIRLIGERRPGRLFGEQADAAVRYGWLDLVCTDLEAQGYAVAAAILGAHSVGAPHRRQRIYFCADAGYGSEPDGRELGRSEAASAGEAWEQWLRAESSASRLAGGGADTEELGGGAGLRDCEPREQRRPESANHSGAGDGGNAAQRRLAMRRSASGNGGHAACAGESGFGDDAVGAGLQGHGGDVGERRGPGWLDPESARSAAAAGATRGFWAGCDWWYGRDGRYRPIEPGVFPLAYGYPARVGILRLAGDAIVVPQAEAFVRSYCEARGVTA